MANSFPLEFPSNQPRTPANQREYTQFKVSFAQARGELLAELDRIGAAKIVISANIPLRKDGLPYAKYSEPTDPGVAVWFVWNGRQYCFACDAWLSPRENLRAIGLQLQALRPIWENRWRVGKVEQFFKGFEQLPPATSKPRWAIILEVDANATINQIKAAYRARSQQCHPDRGGTRQQWDELQAAYQEAMQVRRSA